MRGDVGITGEVAFLGGVVSGGVDVTGSLDVGFEATYDGDWNYAIPCGLGVDIDFVGSILWGNYTGRLDVAEWSTPEGFNLWGSGGGGDARESSDINLAPVDHAMGRSAAGSVIYAYVPVSLDGTATTVGRAATGG